MLRIVRFIFDIAFAKLLVKAIALIVAGFKFPVKVHTTTNRKSVNVVCLKLVFRATGRFHVGGRVMFQVREVYSVAVFKRSAEVALAQFVFCNIVFPM